MGESLFRKSYVLFPADPGKPVKVPAAGIGLAQHDDTHPLAWPQRQRGLRLEQAILVKGLDCSHSVDDDSTRHPSDLMEHRSSAAGSEGRYPDAHLPADEEVQPTPELPPFAPLPPSTAHHSEMSCRWAALSFIPSHQDARQRGISSEALPPSPFLELALEL